MNKLFFVLIHLGCFLVFWVGVSWFPLLICGLFYFIRMFAITGGYHRYFSHRSYKTSRIFRFFLGALGASSAQKGPIWWAASHRHHHKHSDTDEDLHSPGLRGFWWAHAGWVMSKKADNADLALVRDLNSSPELRLLERYHYIPVIILVGVCYLLGSLGQNYFGLLTSPLQMVIWGGFISTVLLYHGTFAINSLAHVFGSKRFNTGDESRNSMILALLTLGEGWHNNHHRYPGSERQGFYWWEIDITHYILKFLERLGIVWDLRSPPQRIYDEVR